MDLLLLGSQCVDKGCLLFFPGKSSCGCVSVVKADNIGNLFANASLKTANRAAQTICPVASLTFFFHYS